MTVFTDDSEHLRYALVLEEPVEVGWLTVGCGGGEGDVCVFRDEAKDDVGAFAEVEVVSARGEGPGPDGDGKGFLAGGDDGVGRYEIPLFGGWADVESFVGAGFEEADEDLGGCGEGEVERYFLPRRDADSFEAG